MEMIKEKRVVLRIKERKRERRINMNKKGWS